MNNEMSLREIYEDSKSKKSDLAQTKEMAEHIGITSQGLHWYESQGLISPQKVESYRRYSVYDLCLLSRIRFYHQVGFSTKEIDNLLNMEIESIAKRMDEHILEIKAGLEKEQAKVCILEERARLTREFSEEEINFSLVETDPFYFKESYRVSRSSPKNPSSTIKDWVDDIPLCQYVLIDILEEFPLERENKVGLALPVKYVPHANRVVQKEIANGGIPLIKSETALYGVLQTTMNDPVSPIERINRLVEKEKYRLEGTMVWKPITCCRAHNEVISYWEIWLPLAH